MCHALLQDPKFFRLLFALIKSWRRRRVLAGVSSAMVFCTAPTIRASHEHVCLKLETITTCASVSAAPCAASAAHRCRCAFSGGAYTWRWRWCWCLPGMPGRHQRRRGRPSAGDSGPHPGTLAPVVADRVSADPAVAGAVRALHAAGRDPSTPRRTSRALCRRDGGAAAAPAALSRPLTVRALIASERGADHPQRMRIAKRRRGFVAFTPSRDAAGAASPGDLLEY